MAKANNATQIHTRFALIMYSNKCLIKFITSWQAVLLESFSTVLLCYNQSKHPMPRIRFFAACCRKSTSASKLSSSAAGECGRNISVKYFCERALFSLLIGALFRFFTPKRSVFFLLQFFDAGGGLIWFCPISIICWFRESRCFLYIFFKMVKLCFPMVGIEGIWEWWISETREVCGENFCQ